MNQLTLEEIRKKIDELQILERQLKSKELKQEYDEYKINYFENIHNKWFLIKTLPYSAESKEIGYVFAYTTSADNIERDRSYHKVFYTGFELTFNEETKELLTFKKIKKDSRRYTSFNNELTANDIEIIREMTIKSILNHFNI